MKKIRCPKCGNTIFFDESEVDENRTFVTSCPECGKKVGVRLKTAKKSAAQASQSKEENSTTSDTATASTEAVSSENFGKLVVIENRFHYKQEFPLHLGDNVIGRASRSSHVDCAIATDDPSMDMTHCVVKVSRDRNGRLKYVLRDGPSNTGTFVGNELLGDHERRVIEDGTLFTLGATSIILSLE
ncbi:FHA domain-containing protein [Hallella absiana]|uniref:FHA domain-containing protein n=1 Tax=Hallella absiana TaxID=2925336 RepID=UPI0021C576CD|nr:FHA domain-containing protein [Hallella absiana]